jgi:hypothetical protein
MEQFFREGLLPPGPVVANPVENSIANSQLLFGH